MTSSAAENPWERGQRESSVLRTPTRRRVAGAALAVVCGVLLVVLRAGDEQPARLTLALWVLLALGVYFAVTGRDAGGRHR